MEECEESWETVVNIIKGQQIRALMVPHYKLCYHMEDYNVGITIGKSSI